MNLKSLNGSRHKHLLILHLLNHCRVVVCTSSHDSRLGFAGLASILLHLRLLLRYHDLRLLLGLFFHDVLLPLFSDMRREFRCWNIMKLLMMNEYFRRKTFENPCMS